MGEAVNLESTTISYPTVGQEGSDQMEGTDQKINHYAKENLDSKLGDLAQASYYREVAKAFDAYTWQKGDSASIKAAKVLKWIVCIIFFPALIHPALAYLDAKFASEALRAKESKHPSAKDSSNITSGKMTIQRYNFEIEFERDRSDKISIEMVGNVFSKLLNEKFNVTAKSFTWGDDCDEEAESTPSNFSAEEATFTVLGKTPVYTALLRDQNDHDNAYRFVAVFDSSNGIIDYMYEKDSSVR
jgi:hypothetical protein